MNRRRVATITAISLVLLIGVVLAALPLEMRFRPEPVRASNAVGDAKCLSCHRQKASFEETAHRLTSRLPTRGNIDASFASGQNVYQTANPYVHFRMDSTRSGFYETAVTGRPPDTLTRTERIDIVTGSGRKGQSFLYWHGDELYQLPVSWWRGFGWQNSPGYRDGSVNFSRPILPRCLECHSSGAQSVPALTGDNRYHANTLILGVTCETCHGSGKAHVRRESWPMSAVPRALVAANIVNPARLPRARKIDGCALCHSGPGTLRTAAFSYVPGQPLGPHLAVQTMPPNQAPDVHGNQVELLELSKCFRSSQMTCATCHDVHQTQRDVAALSGRCLTCHTPQSCGLFPQHGNALVGRCVDCHMPLQPSQILVATANGRHLRPEVRSHWIKVYRDLPATNSASTSTSVSSPLAHYRR